MRKFAPRCELNCSYLCTAGFLYILPTHRKLHKCSFVHALHTITTHFISPCALDVRYFFHSKWEQNCLVPTQFTGLNWDAMKWVFTIIFSSENLFMYTISIAWEIFTLLPSITIHLMQPIRIISIMCQVQFICIHLFCWFQYIQDHFDRWIGQIPN